MVIMTLAFTSSAFADVNMGSGDGTGWGDGTGGFAELSSEMMVKFASSAIY